MNIDINVNTIIAIIDINNKFFWDVIELNWIELNWIELNWIELNCIVLNWIELNAMEVNKI